MAAKVNFEEFNRLKGHQGGVLSITFNVDGNYVFTGGQDKTIRLWNSQRGTQIKSYTGHGWDIFDVCVTKDNSKFASVGGDKHAFLWDITTGRIVRKFYGHSQKINCAALNFDDSVLATGSYDRSVRLWDLKSHMREPIQILMDAKDSISSVKISDGEIMTASTDGCIRTYDLRMPILRVDTIGRDAACILASSLDGVIRLMDKESGEMLADFRGHKNKQYKIDSVMSNNDSQVISGSEDGRICIWDLIEGGEAKSLTAHSCVVSALAYHPKEDMFLSGSVDGNLIVWKSSVS